MLPRKKYKLNYNFSLGGIIILVITSILFYIACFLFAGAIGLFLGSSNNPYIAIPFMLLGFVVGSLGTVILFIKHIVDNIEVLTFEPVDNDSKNNKEGN